MRNKKGFIDVEFIILSVGFSIFWWFVIIPLIESDIQTSFTETKEKNYRTITSKTKDGNNYKYIVTDVDGDTEYITYKNYSVGDTLILEFNKVNK